MPGPRLGAPRRNDGDVCVEPDRGSVLRRKTNVQGCVLSISALTDFLPSRGPEGRSGRWIPHGGLLTFAHLYFWHHGRLQMSITKAKQCLDYSTKNPLPHHVHHSLPLNPFSPPHPPISFPPSPNQPPKAPQKLRRDDVIPPHA